jgi:hypothetical protein
VIALSAADCRGIARTERSHQKIEEQPQQYRKLYLKKCVGWMAREIALTGLAE